jgi:hypothetical protein
MLRYAALQVGTAEEFIYAECSENAVCESVKNQKSLSSKMTGFI